jgi:hypothetical protein
VDIHRDRRTGRLAARVTVAVTPTAQAANESISVDFSAGGGMPTYRASGWIYGMTENASGSPGNYFRDVKFRYMRADGAQLDGPGGWVSGRYDRRWSSTKTQLLRTRSLGGEFILLVHDLWGVDGYPISRFPGDNGDWSDYDRFLARLISDAPSALPTGAWTHVAVTLSGSTGVLYVNGTEVARNTWLTLRPGDLGSTSQNWVKRSQYSGDPYLDPAVDELRLYSRVLSAAEIAQLAVG